MADPSTGDVAMVTEVIVAGLLRSKERDDIARDVVKRLADAGRLLPDGVIDVHLFWIYRWRHRYTGEVQDALHARHTPDDWVQEQRREVRGRGEWKQIS